MCNAVKGRKYENGFSIEVIKFEIYGPQELKCKEGFLPKTKVRDYQGHPVPL